jgi:quinol-cytochrome oxidoreductase complex cytochrome b subunit
VPYLTLGQPDNTINQLLLPPIHTPILQSLIKKNDFIYIVLFILFFLFFIFYSFNLLNFLNLFNPLNILNLFSLTNLCYHLYLLESLESFQSIESFESFNVLFDPFPNNPYSNLETGLYQSCLSKQIGPLNDTE